MEFIENQVGEVQYLTSLADTPTPTSPGSSSTANQRQQEHQPQAERASSSTGDAPVSGVKSGVKRKSSTDDPVTPKDTEDPSAGASDGAGAGDKTGDKAGANTGAKAGTGAGAGAGAGATQPSRKRNRYISIACNECKRRKIKCNGEKPCQRCGNLNLQCLYAPNCCSTTFKDSDEFKQMASQVNHLQEQVETLFHNMSSFRSEALRLAPIQDRVHPLPSAASTPSTSSVPPITPMSRSADLPPPRQSGFRGPTSTRFNLDVAKNTLHKMGYTNPADGGGVGTTTQDDLAGSPAPDLPLHIAIPPNRPPPDPLWEFDKDELVRLCRVHEEEVGLMYPVVKIETVINHARHLTTWMEAAKKNLLVPPCGQDGGINDHNTLVLKIVVCCALAVEEHGNSEKAQRLFNSLRPVTDKMLMNDPSDVKNIPILALVGGYHFFVHDEILAWRTIGQVARLCFELGLHRRDVLEQITDEEERVNAINTFWAAYVLDRRWAFATGLPYVLRDEDIDPRLPSPDSRPHLLAMITYSRVSARVWGVVRQFDFSPSLEIRLADIDDLDRRIKQWYSEIPAEVQLELADWEALPGYLNFPVNSQKEYDIQRLQIWSYLRLNQIRIWLYTPILHTHSSIMENIKLAECAVKLAKNTIRYLTHLNNTTNVYRKMQLFYHQFLLSAITVLFLASCHAPVNFSSSCRDEFYMALELIKDMSSKSWVSKRLWSTIKSLREVAPRLGLAEDPHSNAALTMAGLATGQMGPAPQITSPSLGSHLAVAGQAPAFNGIQNGHQLSSEMSQIFEGYLSKNISSSASAVAAAADTPAVSAAAAVGDSTAMAFGNGGGSVYQHFKAMF
ncbi:hypothetical protein F4779DRAFT_605253 [Xylariaceae sp. FL0662B]|nr:hypothetical protein F4779DRAFT_605253 [Xylariaceae sp. FL0662B]